MKKKKNKKIDNVMTTLHLEPEMEIFCSFSVYNSNVFKMSVDACALFSSNGVCVQMLDLDQK